MKNWLFLNVTNHETRLPYYLYGAGSVYDQEKVDRPRGCPWFQLNICMKGSGILKMKNKEMDIHEGDSLIVFPDIAHEYYPVEGKMIVSWIAFDGFQVNSLLQSMGINFSGIYQFNNNKEIHQNIKDILTIQNEDITTRSYLGSKLVYGFLLNLMKNYSEEDDSDLMKPAIDFMNHHLSEPISIEDIAATMNISPQHFCLKFKAAMDQRPFEYLNSIRITYSKHMLINDINRPVQEVSVLSGYPNHSYFCQLFKKRERLTPAEFRKLYKQSNRTESQ